MNQQVRLGKAAVLTYTPQEGRPDSVGECSITIKTSDNLDLTTPVEDAVVELDDAETTVDAASGVSEDNPRLLHLAATSDVELGGFYLVTDTQGRVEEIEVRGIKDGEYVTLKDPLQRDYTSGNAFVGTKLSYNLSAANAQDPNGDPNTDFRVEWTYVVGGEQFVRETLYDVSRHPWYRAATISGFKRWNSELFSLFDMDTNSGWDDDLDEAFDRVVEQVDTEGFRPNAIVGMDKLVIPTFWELTYSKALAGVLPRYAAQDPETYLERIEANRMRAMDVALKTISWVDKNQDNVKDEDEEGSALQVVRMVQ